MKSLLILTLLLSTQMKADEVKQPSLKNPLTLDNLSEVNCLKEIRKITCNKRTKNPGFRNYKTCSAKITYLDLKGRNISTYMKESQSYQFGTACQGGCSKIYLYFSNLKTAQDTEKRVREDLELNISELKNFIPQCEL